MSMQEKHALNVIIISALNDSLRRGTPTGTAYGDVARRLTSRFTSSVMTYTRPIVRLST